MNMTFDDQRYLPPEPGPDGKIDVTITYLEMRAHPHIAKTTQPLAGHLAVIQARNPTVSFYRFLYHTAGEPWLWYERRFMDDKTLATLVTDSNVRIYVLYVDGVPAGYVELDFQTPSDVELAYFAIFPEFIGRRLGPWLLQWAVNTAWSGEPERFRVNTCSLDHPKALLTYQQQGFTPYRQETIRILDPRQLPSWRAT